MDSVCPASVYTGSSSPFAPTVGTFLSSDQSTLLKDATTASPSLNPVPVFGSLTLTKPVITITGSNTYKIHPFSVTSIIVPTESTSPRYTPATTGYNPKTIKLSKEELQNVYATLTNTSVPEKSRRIIIAASVLTSEKLKGSVTEATESISYDLLYSLQYEFCYYNKYFYILIGDYITVQNMATTNNGFTPEKKNALLQKIINNLTTVKARITDITDLAAYIGKTQTDELKGMNDQINQFVNTTKASVEALNANASILMSKGKESNLRSRQLAYSEEKNAYANQLLAMYGFANLIALGLLFYIYKS